MEMDLAFWADFYTEPDKQEAFDWYCPAAACLPVLHRLIPKQGPVLHIGCGTSVLPRLMATAGWRSIVSVDNCPTAIAAMEGDPANSQPGLTWQVMDATDLRFPDGSFAAVFDKGIVDSILSATPTKGDNDAVFQRMVREIHRVLQPSGAWVCISHNAHRRDVLLSTDVPWAEYTVERTPPVYFHRLQRNRLDAALGT
jgi:SAM-dependent methyltransferase